MKLISGKLVPQALLSILLIGFCFVLTGISVGQNQYYVNASSGSDSNDGSQARPWKTIQHAASALSLGSGGTIVHVAPGSYSGAITTSKSGTASARIVYLSDTKWGAKLTNPTWSVAGSYVTVEGFDLTGPTTSYAFNVNALDNASGPAVHHVILKQNYIHDFMTSGCASTGIIQETPRGGHDFPNYSHDNTYDGNIIRHVGSYNSGVNSCVTLHGFYLSGPGDRIINNIISGVTGWGIKSDPYPGSIVISHNTIFNNGGGISPTETNDAGQFHIWDFNTVTNNIIVNNGVDTPNGGRFGINFYHVTGTHNLVSNNLIYGNRPSDYAHHDAACQGGTPISGSDANGTAGGCPSSNAKSDPGTSVTFVNFKNDTNSAPASNYDSDNYQVAPGSSAVQNGTTNCAPSGISPCVPSTDFLGLARLTGSSLDIGAFAVGSASGVVPTAPTGLTALVQ